MKKAEIRKRIENILDELQTCHPEIKAYDQINNIVLNCFDVTDEEGNQVEHIRKDNTALYAGGYTEKFDSSNYKYYSFIGIEECAEIVQYCFGDIREIKEPIKETIEYYRNEMGIKTLDNMMKEIEKVKKDILKDTVLTVTNKHNKDILLKSRTIFNNYEEFKEWLKETGFDDDSEWWQEYYGFTEEQFDPNKYHFVEYNGKPGQGDIEYALSEGYQLFTWKYIKSVTDEDMFYVRIDPFIEEHLQSYGQVVKKSLFRHCGL